MRIRYSQQSLAWQKPGRLQGIGVFPPGWRQEWFTNLCLAATLTALLFLMLLSIYLVFTKPAAKAVPGHPRTRVAASGTGFAQIDISSDREAPIASGNRG
jgi:hypothetical protein